MQMPSCYGVTILALIAIGAGIAFLIYLGWLTRRGGTVRMPQIVSEIEFAMSRGYDGSRVILRCPGSEGRVCFEKNIRSDKGATFRMVIATAWCTPSQFTQAQEVLRGLSVDYAVERPLAHGYKCIVVESGPDPEHLAVTARAIFTRAFGMAHDAVLRSFYEGTFNFWPTAPNWIGWDLTEDSSRDLTKRP